MQNIYTYTYTHISISSSILITQISVDIEDIDIDTDKSRGVQKLLEWLTGYMVQLDQQKLSTNRKFKNPAVSCSFNEAQCHNHASVYPGILKKSICQQK